MSERTAARPSSVATATPWAPTIAELFDRALVRAMRVEDPTRFTWPVAYEPLFEVARAYGYSWTDANVAAPTTEHDGRRATRPRADPPGLALRARPGGPPPRRRPGGRPLGPSHGQRRRAAPVSVLVRAAMRPADEAQILAVVGAAFADDTRDATEELAIVRGTWAACAAASLVELVADDAGAVVAHALAAPGRLDGTPCAVAGVAPVCVAPSHQGRGIGTALMHALVAEAEARRWPLLVLLGDPAFYGRVGFGPPARSASTTRRSGPTVRTSWRAHSAARPRQGAASSHTAGSRGRSRYSGSAPAPASSSGGGSMPSIARKLSCGPSPSIGDSSTSTTMVSPTRNSFHKMRSESGSSTICWMARRSGRAPSCGS